MGDQDATPEPVDLSARPADVFLHTRRRQMLNRLRFAIPVTIEVIAVKGKGDMPTWYLVGHAAHPHPLTASAPGGPGGACGGASSFR
jgi:hypothetical protein